MAGRRASLIAIIADAAFGGWTSSASKLTDTLRRYLEEACYRAENATTINGQAYRAATADDAVAAQAVRLGEHAGNSERIVLTSRCSCARPYDEACLRGRRSCARRDAAPTKWQGHRDDGYQGRWHGPLGYAPGRD